MRDKLRLRYKRVTTRPPVMLKLDIVNNQKKIIENSIGCERNKVSK